MKRKNFIISFAGQEVIKHTWNASIREIEDVVRDLAREKETTFSLVDELSNKGESGYFESGLRTWESDDGEIVEFSIELE